jgi:GNAT superfamily N-acetyltransferase
MPCARYGRTVISIEPLAAADRADWLPLWHGYLVFYESELADAVTDDVFARMVADDGVHGAIARDDEGRAVGIVHWLTHPSTWSVQSYCYLEDLFVAPDARSGGVGEALIAHVRDWAETSGCEKVYWLTQSSNATARRLYDRVADSTGFVHYEIPLRDS